MQPAANVEGGDRAEIAGAWVERLTGGRASARDIAELRAWVDADPRNREAYAQARAIWAALPSTTLARPVWRSRKAVGSALAACACALVLLAWPRHDYTTNAGSLQHVRLADGTELWLDGASALDVAMTPERRDVTLAGGRAAFRIARDARPFTVHVGEAAITDIGTEFSVERALSLKVAVQEGEVEVRDGSQAVVRLSAGQAMRFGQGARLPFNSASGFTWRDRRILFDRTPLREALAELDRYYPGRIVLTDDLLGGRLVSGTVFSSDPHAALETIAQGQRLKLRRLPWLTLVSAAD